MGKRGHCWVPPAARASVKQQMIRQYSYAFMAVCPFSAETYSLIAPVCNTAAMNELLKGISLTYQQEQILMVLDSAGWHRSKELERPGNIRLELLPPYSPELNPTEHLWDYIREQKAFNNHCFASLQEVEDRLEEVLKNLHQEKDYIPSLCSFHWMIDSS